MHKKFFRLGSLLLSIIIALGVWSQPAIALTDQQRLVSEVWRIVNRSYLDATFNHQNWATVRQNTLKQPLKNDAATYEAISGMVKTLDDPFTRFLTPDQYRNLQVSTSGELMGVGLQIAQNPETQQLEVIAPIAGSPAEKAGIRSRDRILEIEGMSTAKLSLDDAAKRMRGPTGSFVTLLIERDGGEKREFRLMRDRIALNPVIAELHPTPEMPIGYIRLAQFNANATIELAHAVSKLEKQGAKAYILDLRGNPGGLLQSGVEIARLWLDSGTIVYTVNRQGIQGSFEAIGSALTKAPLAVLVNKGTASASEILAGALQDNHRALLIGETTFGKGLIQSLYDLSDGSGLAVTIAKYETPDHHDINKLGIKPDTVIPQEPIDREQIGTPADLQYQAAVQLLSRKAVVATTITKEQMASHPDRVESRY